MKFSKNERKLLAVLIIVCAAVALFLFLPADAAATWKTKISGNGLTVSLSGRSELVGAGGNTIQLRFLAKMAMLPLSFVYQGQAVQGLRVHFSYTVEGADVDWNTLVVTASASGTGGFSQTVTLRQRTGSQSFTLPITVMQLGRQPSANESVVWTLTITVRAEARSPSGTLLSAESRPITSTVRTVWVEDGFQPETSPSTAVPEETGTATVGGGCGPPGHHLVWVSGVEPVSFWVEYGWQILIVLGVLGFAVAVAYSFGKVFKPREVG